MNNSNGANSTRQKVNQNIQVYVRVRPLNQREKSIRSCEVVDVSPPKEIVIRPLLDSKMTKKFTFDRTFGADSKQSDVYLTVVAPLIEEVLSGYNCTVFAYGQTGTGKTHTMVGTECPELKSSWEDESDIGIIPRALSHLFDELRLMEVEFSMRISYLEIYNEELCDLLSSDDGTKIRIFDDSNKKGSVIIQGLEEIPVHSKNDLYKLLEKGKERRRTATTLMNAQSSRSHTVFSILVHIKENGIDGEEMLKIGKLNLVDLAGSENVSKAGNEKGIRTRETVNINQSLLTLGRVITALVERTPHIPYRESKLTRLLQESLGGRTKTSIIATISPGHKDIEETLSTLEYAHRAKNIQNKPEVNQKLTKRVVLKEYTEEIDRLKRDLLATRDKNGIYLADDTYNEMLYKMDAQNKELNEKMLLVKALKDDLANKERIFNEVSLHLINKTEILQQTEKNFNMVQSDLANTRKVLSSTKRRYKEKKVILENHIQTEEKLTTQANELIEVADIATRDTLELHNTLERRKDVDVKIKSVCELFIEKMKSSFKDIDEGLMEMTNDHNSHSMVIQDEIDSSSKDHKKFEAGAMQQISTISINQQQCLTDLVKCIREHLSTLSLGSTEHKSNIDAIIMELKHKEEYIKTDFQKRFQTIEMLLKSQNEIIVSTMENVLRKIESSNDVVNQYSIEARSRLESIYEDARSNFQAAICSIQSNLEDRKSLRSKRIKAFDEFIKQMQDIEKQELKQDTVEEEISNHLVSNKAKIESTFSQNIQLIESYCEKNKNDRESIEQMLKVFEEESTKKCDNCQSDILDAIKVVDEHLTSNSIEIDRFGNSLESNCNKTTGIVSSCLDDVARKYDNGTQKISTDCKVLHSLFQEESSRFKEYQTQSSALNTSLQSTVKEFVTIYSDKMNNCLQHLDTFKQHELKTYAPTGQTPSKKEFSYPRVLAATSPHSKIIKRIREEHDWSDLDATTLESENTISEISAEPIPFNSTPIKESTNSKQFLETNMNTASLNLKGNKPPSRRNSPAIGITNKGKENIN